MSTQLKFGILTVSDSCHLEPLKDQSGPKLIEEVLKHFPCSLCTPKIVPDHLDEITNTLVQWSNEKYNVILTTGGTGFSSRDVTPEATLNVIEKKAPALTYAMTSNSLKITPMAMLSRAVCGIRSQTLIINLPGSKKAAIECFGFIKDVIPHAVALLTDQKESVASLHNKMQRGGSIDVQPSTRNNEMTPSKVKLKVAARDRKSPYPMIEVSKAFEIVLRECTQTQCIETVPFEKSLNRVLAEDVHALEPVPPFRASIKDGYAVRAEDGAGIRRIKNVAAAGDKPFENELQSQEAVRISTGAPVPAGANAVVQVEDTSVVEASTDGSIEVSVKIEVTPRLNQDIRQIGSDVQQNSLVLNKYHRIQPFHIGVLAMLGKTKVKIYKCATIGIISTGNEICDPGEALEPGKIRDANKVTLMNLLKQYSYNPRDCGVAKDNPDSVKYALEKAFTQNDVVITSGGVSMGEFDVIKQVLLEDFGATIHFARVNMKPGKPTTFATLIYKEKRKIFFGLPGNPVSCGVTCLLYIIPVLRYMENSVNFKFPVIRAKAPNLKNNDPRPEYHRVQVKISPDSGELVAYSTGDQISSRLNSLIGANGLAVVKQNHDDTLYYEVMLFDELIGFS
ncbi:unnamed protein product [Psylliodes chrysocephalus]|uniref:MoaB/Mog domain-containing protein n=1 Tax=Psylliodes chrysocephalus TaxID=3402493 RepID=A0A9P0CEH3_9CUCU|nr:unnamed protein product [Psylliodes chrysocephala]